VRQEKSHQALRPKSKKPDGFFSSSGFLRKPLRRISVLRRASSRYARPQEVPAASFRSFRPLA
jgi:hypothetical protein